MTNESHFANEHPESAAGPTAEPADTHEGSAAAESSASSAAAPSTGSTTTQPPAPLKAIERRILGVLMEKARTTPDAYPLSLNGLVTGCNQKSNRHPLMNLSMEVVEDAITEMRKKQLVAEVHGGGRVPKYRHYGYDYMGVKGVEAGVMTELLLRGEQTAGEIRTRASRFEPISDLTTMQQILDRLIERGLVTALTPPGRGQLFSHNLYEPQEMEKLRQSLDGLSSDTTRGSGGVADSSGSSRSAPASQELEALREEVRQLRSALEQLTSRVESMENSN